VYQNVKQALATLLKQYYIQIEVSMTTSVIFFPSHDFSANTNLQLNTLSMEFLLCVSWIILKVY